MINNILAKSQSLDNTIYHITWKDGYEIHDNFMTIDGNIGNYQLFFMYDKTTGNALIMDKFSMPMLFWTFGTYKSGFEPATIAVEQRIFTTANDVHILCNIATPDLTQSPLVILNRAGIIIPPEAYLDANYTTFKPGIVETQKDEDEGEDVEEYKFHFMVGKNHLRFNLLPNFGDSGWSRMYLIENGKEFEVLYGTNVIDKRAIVLYAKKDTLQYLGRINTMAFTRMIDSYISATPAANDYKYAYYQLFKNDSEED